MIKNIIRTTTSVPAIGPISASNEASLKYRAIRLYPNPSADRNIKIDFGDPLNDRLDKNILE